MQLSTMLAAAQLHCRQLLHVQQQACSILGAIFNENRLATSWCLPNSNEQSLGDVEVFTAASHELTGAISLPGSCPNSSSDSCAKALQTQAYVPEQRVNNQQKHNGTNCRRQSAGQSHNSRYISSSYSQCHTSSWPVSSRCSKQTQQLSRYTCSHELHLRAPVRIHSCSWYNCSSTLGYAAAGLRPFSSSSSSSSVLSGDSSSSSSSSPTWVDKYLPHRVRPYAQLMRLDKPIGSWLLAWPGFWTIALAAEPGHLPDPWLTSLFAVGAVLMRGAGCTVNDLWDQDIDKQVQRTRSRPLAAGAVSQNAALAFLAAQLLLSFSILLQLNTYTQVLGWCSLALVGTYPLMKRVTWWPQAFLGLCMNYGVLMGYSAAHGSCDWSVVLPMYAAGVAWTLVYDTIYAHQDKVDDAQIGVKSTALLFGDQTKTWAAGFAVLQTLGLVTAGGAAGMGVPYYAAVAAGAGHQAWQIGSVDLNNGADCMAKFVSNKWYGAILYAGIVVDRVLATGV